MQFYPYDGVQPQTKSDSENNYGPVYLQLAKNIRQIKSIQSIQKSLMAMTNEALPSMVETIKLYLKNEVKNKNNKLEDLLAITELFNTYGSDNFWWNFYAHHLDNSMIEMVVRFIV